MNIKRFCSALGVSLLFVFLLFISVSVLKPSAAFAHQSGCHRWHSCPSDSGSYVCGDLGYTSGCPQGTPPIVNPTPDFPYTEGSFVASPNSDGTYNIDFTLNDINPSRYSVIISKTLGADPGPSVDYTSPYFHFQNILPGIWYVNAKKDINNTWSYVRNWTVNVPAWVAPTPTVIPTSLIQPQNNLEDNSSNKSIIGKFFDFILNFFK